MKNVLEFEPHIRLHIKELVEQWDKLCDAGAKGLSSSEGEGGWSGKDGRVWFDCLPCKCFARESVVRLCEDEVLVI
jgi:benzoate 4-monooxygenase